MNFIKIILLFFLLSGCLSTGGKSPSSKSLIGQVDGNIYLAADNLFSVQMPAEANGEFWPYLKLSEQYSEQLTTVVFTISTNKYHWSDSYAVLIDRTQSIPGESLNLNEAVEWLTEKYSKPVSKDRLGIHVLQRFDINLNGRPAVLLSMKEEIADTGLFANDSEVAHTSYHIMAIQSSEQGIANVWVQLQNCDTCESGSKDDILNTNNKVKRFIQSFKFKQ